MTFPKHAVMFDLDGTLLDTLADIARSANEVLRAEGFPAHPVGAYRRFIGDGVAVLFGRALPAGAADHDAGLVDRCVEGFRVVYGRGWNVETKTYDGVPELLDALTRRGLKLAVLSNKPDDFTRLCAAEYLSRWPFAAAVGQREGVLRKPDPAGAIELAERLGVPAAGFVYVGDTPVDMETARRAGMRAVGVAWGFRPAEELREAGASAVIERPDQLLGLLEG